MDFTVFKPKYLGLLALASAVIFAFFASGFYFGEKHSAISTTLLLDGIQALDNVAVLKILNQGDMESAMKHLDLELDEEVIEMDGYRKNPILFSSTDREQKIRTLHVLQIVAESRALRIGRKSGSLLETDQRVQAILESAVKTSGALQSK